MDFTIIIIAIVIVLVQFRKNKEIRKITNIFFKQIKQHQKFRNLSKKTYILEKESINTTMQNKHNLHFKSQYLLIPIGIILLVIILTSIFVTVPTGYRGVVTRFGKVTGKVFDEGIHVKIPFVEKVNKINVQIQKEQNDADSSSKDLQSVHATIALNYRIDVNAVQNLYQDVGKNYVSKIIDPVIQEAVKSGTARFTAEELITKREEVKDVIGTIMTETLSKQGISVVDFNIVDFKFSSAFDNAIEAKVTAEQEALAAKNKLEQIKFEAQQAVESAKGRAEAIEIEAAALRNNPDVLELRSIEKWNGVLPQVTGDSVPFINL